VTACIDAFFFLKCTRWSAKIEGDALGQVGDRRRDRREMPPRTRPSTGTTSRGRSRPARRSGAPLGGRLSPRIWQPCRKRFAGRSLSGTLPKTRDWAGGGDATQPLSSGSHLDQIRDKYGLGTSCAHDGFCRKRWFARRPGRCAATATKLGVIDGARSTDRESAFNPTSRVKAWTTTSVAAPIRGRHDGGGPLAKKSEPRPLNKAPYYGCGFMLRVSAETTEGLLTNRHAKP